MAQRRFKAELFRCALYPRIAAVGRAAVDTAAQGFEFGDGLRVVDVAHPVSRPGDWPVAEEFLLVLGLLPAVPEAAPTPVFGLAYEVGAQRVALDVTTDGQQVVVGCDEEGLEATLVQVAGADGAVRRVPALGMGERQQAQVVGEIAERDKRCQEPFHGITSFLGHPRWRSVDSRPSCFAVRCTHVSLPGVWWSGKVPDTFFCTFLHDLEKYGRMRRTAGLNSTRGRECPG